MITIKNYTMEDIEYIKSHYYTSKVKDIASYLNKTENSVYNAIRKLGLKKQIHKPWTDDEINYLKTNYETKTSEEISKVLGRTVDSINTERDCLGLVRNPKWTDEEVLFLCQNYDKYTHEQIGEKLNRTTSAVTAKCFDLNLYKKDLPWENWEIEFLKDNYMEKTQFELSRILNRTESAIHLKASRLGLKKYPYTCNYSYFNVIDTEEKAYWLGFLTADGWINRNEKTNAGVVGIELQYSDNAHLKKFNKSISGNYQITDRWKHCLISKKDKEKKHHMCIIRIFSLTMYNDLVKLGFTNEKTFDCYMPNISEDLMRHYIRGYFDGDGCLTFTNKSFNVKFITASRLLFHDLKTVLESIDIKVNDCNYISEFGTPMFGLSIDKFEDKIQFLDWIYQDANIYLDRKYKKYLKVKNQYNTHAGLAG